ncbi:MAG TPA: 50S ribosomal protein L35 [Rickettsiales bacterium]|nr:50S ribosomal protein L35 [Rickettsiales bacterium]
MPKMKTNSSCKKRFSLTGTGKIKFKNSGKRHCMSKRSKRQIRENRGPDFLFDGDASLVLKSFLPYGLGDKTNRVKNKRKVAND